MGAEKSFDDMYAAPLKIQHTSRVFDPSISLLYYKMVNGTYIRKDRFDEIFDALNMASIQLSETAEAIMALQHRITFNELNGVVEEEDVMITKNEDLIATNKLKAAISKLLEKNWSLR